MSDTNSKKCLVPTFWHVTFLSGPPLKIIFRWMRYSVVTCFHWFCGSCSKLAYQHLNVNHLYFVLLVTHSAKTQSMLGLVSHACSAVLFVLQTLVVICLFFVQ